MAYETTKVVKTLRFPGDTTNQYQINAVRLDGHTYSEIDERIKPLENFDALRYMGTIAGSTTAPGGLTVAANKGDVYKVTTAGYVMGAKVEVGDMLICNTDETEAATSTNYTTVAANWDIIQSNIDVDAILAHTHTGNVTLVKSDKTLKHTVQLTQGVTPSFTSGSASVTGEHTHTASGSVSITPGGTVEDTSVKPEGTVKLTSVTTAGTNDVTLTPSGTVNNSTTSYVTSVTVDDHAAHTHTGTTNNNAAASVTGSITIKTGTGTANYTPAGTVGNSSTAVTAVTAGSNTISAHEGTITAAGAHTPAGSVTVNDATAGGSVAAHTHSVKLTSTNVEDDDKPVGSITTTYTAGTTGYDGTLTIIANPSTATYLSSASVTEQSVAPTFTGTKHNHTASFSGTAVAAHTHGVTIEDHEAIVPSINVTKGNHNHSFTGTGVQLVATHSLTAPVHNHDFTTDANTEGLSHTVNAPVSVHGHTFTGNGMNVHAAFTGTSKAHNHTFTGSAATHGVTVTVDKYTGTFNGTATGTVSITNAANIVTGVTISDHTIKTVDSASVTTGTGVQ